MHLTPRGRAVLIGAVLAIAFLFGANVRTPVDACALDAHCSAQR